MSRPILEDPNTTSIEDFTIFPPSKKKKIFMDTSKKNNLFDKYKARISSSGRSIKTPKNVVTTSDDKQVTKKSKSVKSLEKQLEELQKLAESVQKSQESSKLVKRVDSSPLEPAITIKTVASIIAGIKSRYSSVTDFPGDQHSELKADKIVIEDITLPIHEEEDTFNDGRTSEDAEEAHEEFPESSDKEFRSFVLQSLKNLEQQNKDILLQNKEILHHLSRLNSGGENLADTLFEPLTGFPLMTVAEFDELNSDLNEKNRQNVHDHLVRLSGSKLKEFLSSALKEIMVDELVTKFTWHKQNGSEKFGDTRVSNILYQAAKKCPLFRGPENKQEFKNAMLDVLKNTKQRFRMKQVKKPIEKTEPSTEDVQKQIEELREIINKQSAHDADISSNEEDEDEIFES